MLCIEGSRLKPPTPPFGPSEPPFLRSNFVFVFVSILGPFLAPKRDPKVCQNASKTCTISILFSDLCFCFILTNFQRPPGLQICLNMLFFQRFSIIFAFPHVVLTFVFALLLCLELGPFWVPKRCQKGSQIDARKGLKMYAFLDSILGPFGDPFGDIKRVPELSRIHVLL